MRRTPLFIIPLLSCSLFGCSDDSRTHENVTDDDEVPDAEVTRDTTQQTHTTEGTPDAGSGVLDASDGATSTASPPEAGGQTTAVESDDTDASVCAWTIDELLAQVNLEGTYAFDCGERLYAQDPKLLTEGIACLLNQVHAEADAGALDAAFAVDAGDGSAVVDASSAGARFVDNQCPDCKYEQTYLRLSGGEYVLILRTTQLGEPNRGVTVRSCETFGAEGSCQGAQVLYQCEDLASSGHDW